MIGAVETAVALSVLVLGCPPAQTVEQTGDAAVDTALVRKALVDGLASVPERLSQLGIPGAAIAVVHGGFGLEAGHGVRNTSVRGAQ